jgi:stage V sporulation protein D (sporulation-specific penicillin-binding protein)
VLAQTQKNNQYEIIKRCITSDEALSVREFKENNGIKSVTLIQDTKRYYPYGNFASHILGFVGTENQGLDG